MHIFANDCIRCAVAPLALEATYPAPRASRCRLPLSQWSPLLIELLHACWGGAGASIERVFKVHDLCNWLQMTCRGSAGSFEQLIQHLVPRATCHVPPSIFSRGIPLLIEPLPATTYSWRWCSGPARAVDAGLSGGSPWLIVVYILCSFTKLPKRRARK